MGFVIVKKQWQKSFVNQQLTRLFFYYTICIFLCSLILRWLGALAAPGKLLPQGAVSSEAAQLPLSRAKCPAYV